MGEKDIHRICKSFLRWQLVFLFLSAMEAVYARYDEKVNSPEALIGEITDEDNVSFSVVSDNGGTEKTLLISASQNGSGSRLSDGELETLNRLINTDDMDIRRLDLSQIGDQIDFSKLDLSSIDTIQFFSLKESFDYSGFLNTYFTDIEFVSTPLTDSLKKYLDQAVLDYADLEISCLDRDIAMYLAENHKPIRAISSGIYEWNSDFITVLPEISAKEVNLVFPYVRDDKAVQLQLGLNDRVDTLNLKFRSMIDTQNLKLGSIGVESSNDNIEINIIADDTECSVDIGDKTEFHFPDQAYVTFENVTCSSVEAFNSLDNVSGLDYSDGQGKEISFVDKNSSNRKVKYKY